VVTSEAFVRRVLFNDCVDGRLDGDGIMEWNGAQFSSKQRMLETSKRTSKTHAGCLVFLFRLV